MEMPNSALQGAVLQMGAIAQNGIRPAHTRVTCTLLQKASQDLYKIVRTKTESSIQVTLPPVAQCPLTTPWRNSFMLNYRE